MRSGQIDEARTESVGFSDPIGESFGAMKGEDATRARVGVAGVAEECFDAGRFVEERKRAGETGGEKVRKAGGIAGGLLGHGRERGAFFYCFGHADRATIYEEKIITGAGLERNFAKGDASAGGEIGFLVILHDPPARDELRVDLLAGGGFGGHGKLEGRPNSS